MYLIGISVCELDCKYSLGYIYGDVFIVMKLFLVKCGFLFF